MTSLSGQQGKPPDRRARATMRDVAALAGVGIKTVSRVVNDEPNVSPATVRNVLDAVKTLQYEPNLQAGNLRRNGQRTHAVGLMVGDIANPFFASIHRGVEDVAAARSAAVLASSLDDDADKEREIVSAFLRRRVDGLILTTILPSQSYLVREQELGTPLVFIDRAPVGIHADTVISDNVGGARLATQHLLAAGHRKIACLTDNSEIFTARKRKEGYLEQLTAAGVGTHEEYVIDNLTDQSKAYQATRDLLETDDPPTAIFSALNLITDGTVRALRHAGKYGTIALVGFDDLPMADCLDPGVSVVAQDARQMGALAAQRLFARIDTPAVEAETFVVPTTLIERGSGEVAPYVA